jgi:tetratricopeptide (TPR) repeat protein
MELVGGIKITDYCEQNRLTTRERLDLFMQVCRAVQHAHQKGVIHRDIKPSNVLVATQDGVPVPKVIDFGIAKATQGKLTDQTVFTAFEQFLGTPAYMSPEQTQLGGLDVDTRSDIYSLGVLLYELLTGKTPFDTKELLAAGLEAMRRAIQEKEPPTPSTRLAQERAATRSTSPGKSEIGNRKSEIDRDLDWIVMKCLEKDRARRYETANGLARDIERHLENEPVVAGPPSRLYRFQKMVRRNKATTIATALILLVLVLGILGSTWQAFRARKAEQQARRSQAKETKERQKAQTEAAKSEQVAQFLKDMLQSVGPAKARGRDTTMLREIMDKTAEGLGTGLTNQPEVELELRDILGTIYYQLGLYKQMEQMVQGSLRLARAHSGQDSLAVARALEQLAEADWCLADYDPAEKAARESLAIRQRLLGKEHADIANSLNTLGLVFRSKGLLTEAEGIFRDALVMARSTETNREALAMVIANLGQTILEQAGSIVAGQAGPGGSEAKLALAEALLNEALGIRRTELGNDHPDTIMTLELLGSVLEKQLREAEAEAVFREVLTMQKKVLGNEHVDVAVAMNSLATALYYQDKFADAETVYRESLAIERKLRNPDHPEVASVIGNLANVQNRQGKLAESEQSYREVLDLLRKRLGDDHPQVATCRYNLALTLTSEGKHAEAEQLLLQAMPIMQSVFGQESPGVATLLNHLGEAQAGQKKLTEAEATYRDAVVMERKILGDQHPYLASTFDCLVAVLEQEGKLSDLEALYQQRVQALRALGTNGEPRLASVLAQLASNLLAQGKFSDAEGVARECLSLREKLLPDDWRTFNTRSLLGGSLLGQQKYADAQPLLLSGYEGMKRREAQIPPRGKVNLHQTLERLVKLFESTGQTNQAVRWKRQLEEFERSQAHGATESKAK